MKTSVTLSSALLEEIDRLDTNRSHFSNAPLSFTSRGPQEPIAMPETRQYSIDTPSEYQDLPE